MSVIIRTWPYGTRYTVRVVESKPSFLLVVEDDIGEAFVLVNHGVVPLPAVGSNGSIRFTQGGPKGGYWKFER